MNRCFRLLVALAACALVSNSFAAESAAATDPAAFKASCESFFKEWEAKSGQIRSQQEFDAFMKWQGEETSKLMAAAPPEPFLPPDVTGLLGRLHQLKESYEKAVELYTKCLAGAAGSPEAAKGLVECLLELKKFEDAEAAYLKHSEKVAKEARGMLLLGLGQAFSDAGRYQAADKYFKTALGTPDLPDQLKSAIVELAVDNDVQAGKKDEAVAFLKSQMDGVKDDPLAVSQMTSKLDQIESVGSPAPELAIAKWVGDKKTSLAELKGKVVLLDFWAPWCSPCRAAMPHLRKIYEKSHDKGLEIVGITTYYGTYRDSKKTEKSVSKEREFELVSEFAKSDPLPWYVGVSDDNKNHEGYHVNGIPHLVVIDKAGKIRKIEVGFNPQSNKLDALVDELLK